MKVAHNKGVLPVSKQTAGADWLVGMHMHFGQTGEYRGADVFRLLGDQRLSFDMTGQPSAFSTCHEQADSKS